MENPEKYFTDEVMQALDEVSKQEFSYGWFGFWIFDL
jgi:hypothetical protein